jgi:hypothetical protein
MNTYTKIGGGVIRLSNPVPRLSGAKRPWRSRGFSRIKESLRRLAHLRNGPAAARCDGRRIGCGCPILRDVCEGWVRARLWRVHWKGEETAAGLKAPALRLNLNRSAFLRRRKLILWVDFRRRSDGLRQQGTN